MCTVENLPAKRAHIAGHIVRWNGVENFTYTCPLPQANGDKGDVIEAGNSAGVHITFTIVSTAQHERAGLTKLIKDFFVDTFQDSVVDHDLRRGIYLQNAFLHRMRFKFTNILDPALMPTKVVIGYCIIVYQNKISHTGSSKF